MRTWLLTGLFLSVALLAGDAFAMCGGGGRGGGISGGGRGRSAKKSDETTFKKWDLPAAVAAPEFKTASFDAVADKLELSSDQLERIGAARSEIAKELARLAKAQNDSRAAYEKAAKECEARSAAQRVAAAMQALSGYDPNRKFEEVLRLTLSSEQLRKLRELSA